MTKYSIYHIINSMKSFKSVKEIAKDWNISERQVRNLCENKKIKEAIKIGHSYIIPADAIKPKRKKNEVNLEVKFSKDRSIYNLKYNYVIVHGTFGHPGENWFPWLAEAISSLDKSGNTSKEDILIPHFPSSSYADYDSWKSVLMGYIDSGIINKDTIFICHSLGPLFISRVLIEEKVKVKGLISVEAAANHLMGNESFDRINSTFFVPSWEYLDQLKDYIDFNYCFYTDNDPHIPYNILKKYIDHAATKSFFIQGAGHFNESSGYTTFPQLLELIKQIEIDENVNVDSIEKINNPYKWDKTLSHKWTNMTWPNRPSVSELSIYTKHLRYYQIKNKNIKCLILGSNVEYRDWAYEEYLNVSIMHNNEEYHLATYRELRHKNAPYKLILKNWQEISFDDEYDIIVGDQLIGNTPKENIDNFLKRVSKSLKENGLFLSKSYYIPQNYKTKTTEQIFSDYYKFADGVNPLAYCGFDLTCTCLDKDNYVDFSLLNQLINDAYKERLITKDTYDFLNNIGLDKMNYHFYVPTIEEYEKIVLKYFDIIEKTYTNDIGSENFPIYILKKKSK